MTQKEAEAIVEWHYPSPYDFYDMKADEDDLNEFLDSKVRKEQYYSVYHQDELVGFFSFIQGESDTVDVGLGMKPELTGASKGLTFIKEGLKFAIEKYQPEYFTLSVATFNKRAIKAYERVGFHEVKKFRQPTNGSVFEFIKMKKTVKE